MHGESELEPPASPDSRPPVLRRCLVVVGGASVLGLMAWFGLWRPTLSALEFPAPLAAPGLAAVTHDPRTPATLPVHLVRRNGRIVSDQDGAELVYVPPLDESVPDAPPTSTGSAPAVRARHGFFIDRHEVTVGQFRRFCILTKTEMPEQPEEDVDSMPVVNVSWGLADAYAQWAGRRLPTAEEWTRAASHPDGRKYPWGALDDVSLRNGPGMADGNAGLTPVGFYPGGASALGLVDLAGNAWEWTSDVTFPRDSPEGKLSRLYHIVKGGGAMWRDELLLANQAESFMANFAVLARGVGFRLVIDEGR
jgi:formylglycine-generating enzyme required for sulfatase activity